MEKKMQIKEMIVILLASLSVLVGQQLGLESISIWIGLLIAFGLGVLTFVLLSKDIWGKKNE
jgi:high-affinity Fe2+/Pb2+ permease